MVREAPRSGVGSGGGSVRLGTSLLPVEPSGPEQGPVWWVSVTSLAPSRFPLKWLLYVP